MIFILRYRNFSRDTIGLKALDNCPPVAYEHLNRSDPNDPRLSTNQSPREPIILTVYTRDIPLESGTTNISIEHRPNGAGDGNQLSYGTGNRSVQPSTITASYCPTAAGSLNYVPASSDAFHSTPGTTSPSPALAGKATNSLVSSNGQGNGQGASSGQVGRVTSAMTGGARHMMPGLLLGALSRQPVVKQRSTASSMAACSNIPNTSQH